MLRENHQSLLCDYGAKFGRCLHQMRGNAVASKSSGYAVCRQHLTDSDCGRGRCARWNDRSTCDALTFPHLESRSFDPGRDGVALVEAQHHVGMRKRQNSHRKSPSRRWTAGKGSATNQYFDSHHDRRFWQVRSSSPANLSLALDARQNRQQMPTIISDGPLGTKQSLYANQL